MCLRYCIALLVTFVAPAAAQGGAQAVRTDSTVTPTAKAGWVARMVLPGSPGDDARRIGQLLHGDSTNATLIRSTATLSDRIAPGGGTGVRAALLGPVVELTHNSTLPYSLNDGSMWAGRGMSYRVTGGAMLAVGGVRVVVAPEVAYAQNEPVYVIPSDGTGRSAFASPWFSGMLPGAYSADLPLRFGSESLRMITLGQSRVDFTHRGVTLGAATEDQWWGPGIHNSLVLGNGAPGIPHAFVRTARPVHTRIGDIEARWMLGGLTESIYFDYDAANDVRSISALAATLRLAMEPGLTLGIARAVYGPVGAPGEVALHALDVIGRWGQTDGVRDGVSTPDSSEQVLSLFGRWVFPRNGLELYGEWARQQLPASLRDLLVAPQESQAFTVGMQVVRPALGGALRGSVEATNLEQTPEDGQGAVQSFYVSRYVPQGYTQRGQPVGAGIGPGSSSQWLAVDYLRPRWRLGAQVGRIRWNEDSYVQQETGVQVFAHDVSLLASLRGVLELRGIALHAELTRAHRLNYLFQNFFSGAFPDTRFDENNTTLRLGAAVVPWQHGDGPTR